MIKVQSGLRKSLINYFTLILFIIIPVACRKQEVTLPFIVPSTSVLPGMYVNNRYLFSAGNDTVILKGFNAMIVYWDIHGDINFPEIEKTGANCVRIFWNLAVPTPQPSDLDKVLGNCISHHMIPIICLWDATGKWDQIQLCVDYWSSTPIVSVLKKYEKHLIINIANEPGDHEMGNIVFRDTYATAVSQLRRTGLHMPLIIDADRWGRNADAVLDNGQSLVEADPDHNLVFSWHLWDPENYMTGTVQEIDRIIAKAVDKNICFVVGEFGPCEQTDNCASTPINWEHLVEAAYKNKIGYLPWVWKWTDCHSIVNSSGIYGSWANTEWGENVAVKNTYSIQKTAQRPSDF
jgi:mannan endo-1,4-beta-mannosidase